MPIDGNMRNELKNGMRFVAKFKGTEYGCEVIEVDGKVRFRLPDGAVFGSPSGAGREVMGTACNGWRFWSIAEEGEGLTPAGMPVAKAKKAAEPKAKKPRKSRAKVKAAEVVSTAA
jgi:hypothetical protein